MRQIPVDSHISLRLLQVSDAAEVAAAYRRNREHLREWEPARCAEFFTEGWQAENIASVLTAAGNGLAFPYGLFHQARVIGRFNLTGIIRGPFQSASLGYWVDHGFTGRGIATKAVGALRATATRTLGLHRIEASTLLHNVNSQRVLLNNGFTQIGMAPEYLKINGRWQDHNLYQAILHHAAAPPE